MNNAKAYALIGKEAIQLLWNLYSNNTLLFVLFLTLAIISLAGVTAGMAGCAAFAAFSLAIDYFLRR